MFKSTPAEIHITLILPVQTDLSLERKILLKDTWDQHVYLANVQII